MATPPPKKRNKKQFNNNIKASQVKSNLLDLYALLMPSEFSKPLI